MLWFFLFPGSECRRGRVYSPFSYPWAPVSASGPVSITQFDLIPPDSDHHTRDLRSGQESGDGWGGRLLSWPGWVGGWG